MERVNLERVKAKLMSAWIAGLADLELEEVISLLQAMNRQIAQERTQEVSSEPELEGTVFSEDDIFEY